MSLLQKIVHYFTSQSQLCIFFAGLQKIDMQIITDVSVSVSFSFSIFG